MIPRPLLYLVGLNLRAKLRKTLRSFRGGKGILMLLVFGGFLAIFISSLFVRQDAPPQPPAPPRTGAFVLFAYTVLSALGGIKTRGMYFPPSELEFLFTAPFRRRELMAYRLLTQLATVPIVAAFFALFLMRYSSSYLAAWMGTVLMFALVSIVNMTVSLAASSLSERLARASGPIVFIGGIAGFLFFIMLIHQSAGGSSADLGGGLTGFTESLVGKIVLAPFVVFTRVFTAERFWPEMAQATAGSLGILVALVGLLFLLDIDYREAAIETSRRVQVRLRSIRRSGHALSEMKRLRLRLPPLPRWGGVGPVAWRQLIEAGRNAPALLLSIAFFAVLFFALFSQGPGSIGVAVALLFVMSQRLTFDFRGDGERMEILKAFPIRNLTMALGQVLVPVVILTVLVETGLAVLAFSDTPSVRHASYAGLVMAPLVSMIVIALENILFLLYPAGSRVVPGDVGTLARSIVTMLLKMLCLAVIGALAFLAGYVAYRLSGESLVAAVGTAWIVCALAALGSLLLCSWAYGQYDVSRERIED